MRLEFSVPESIDEARRVQNELRSNISLVPDLPKRELIAGVDVGYDNERGLAHASIVILQMQSLKPVEQVQVFLPVDFPYVPGFLSFREIPAILAAIAQLKYIPDLWMVDGQGIAHPRRMGIAAHLGLVLNAPSLGVGKSRLFGNYTEPGPDKGDANPLMHGAERIGTVLRSKEKTNALFISPGHKMDWKTSLEVTLACLTKYRLPEPTRIADKYSKVSAEVSQGTLL